MTYRPILGALGFVVSPDRKKTLLVHRNARKEDDHYNKYNGLGGKMLPGEDIVSCIKREIMEEAGLICKTILLRGTINWTGFGPNGEDWLGFIFRIALMTTRPPFSVTVRASRTVSPTGVKSIAQSSLSGGVSPVVPTQSAPNFLARF